MTIKLPPGVSARGFDSAVQRLQSVVGKEWVFTNDADVDLYRDPYSPFFSEAEEYIPSGAVAPSSVEQVQEIVRIANAFKVPLWPISTGRNLGYGGPAPRMSGTLVLDLKRMNRVLEVDDKRAYALVEPGVSYFDFHRYLQEHQLKVWLDCPDPGWGSMIGNALEHGVGHTPMRDHFDAHCGMEVVLPNGELLRTGMGALPGSRSWQTFKYGFGPHISPIFGQSNFGVVTKMGFWLLPQPEASRSYVISVQRREEAVPLLDTMSYLVGSGLVDSTWNIGSPLLSANDDEVKAARAADAPVEEMERLGRAKNLGYWGMRLRFYDPVDVIDAKWRHVSKRLSAIPGFTFKEGKSYEFPLDPTTLEEPVDDAVIKPAFGIPNLAIFNRGGVNRSQGHVYFSPIIPMSGVEYLKAQTVFAAAFKELGLRPPSVTGGWSWFKRNLVLLTGMEITHDVESNRKLRAGYKRLVQISAENGWGEYRAAAAFMDDVMASFSFNNHALLRFHETLKDALDPNGILAPGKSGIWPKHLRGDRA